MEKNIIIAIDGPAGAGKSSVSKAVSQKLGYTYIDTGAMYRACALMAIETGVDVRQYTNRLPLMFEDFELSLKQKNGRQLVILNDIDITREIREPDISIGASYISAIPYVRDKMVELQRKMAENESVVMDGRDIGTNVFPNADVKIFLTADVNERAKRRLKELLKKGTDTTLEKVLEDMQMRDKNDSERAYAPLKKADDAIVVDNTNLTFEESVDSVIGFINGALKGCK